MPETVTAAEQSWRLSRTDDWRTARLDRYAPTDMPQGGELRARVRWNTGAEVSAELVGPDGVAVYREASNDGTLDVAGLMPAGSRYIFRLAEGQPSTNIYYTLTATPAADTTPPVAEVLEPVDGATVAGTFELVVSASDAGGLDRVTATVGDGPEFVLQATAEGGHYTAALDSTGFAEDVPTTIAVEAVDLAGNAVQLTTTVVADNAPPPEPPRVEPFSTNSDGPMVWLPGREPEGALLDNWHTLRVDDYDGPLNTRQDAYLARLLGSIADHGTYFDRANYATAVLPVEGDGAGRHNIGFDDTGRKSTRTSIPSDWLDPAWNAPARLAAIPDALQVTIPPGRDGSAILYDPTTGETIHGWRWRTDGREVPSGAGRVVAIDPDGTPSPYLVAHMGKLKNAHTSWAGAFRWPHGTTACGLLNAPGLVGLAEAYRARDTGDVHALGHALYFLLPNKHVSRYNSDRPYSKPANRTDGLATKEDTAAIPQGTRMGFAPEGAPGFDPAWTWAGWAQGKTWGEQLFASAMMRHGFWLGDSTWSDNTTGGEAVTPEHRAYFGTSDPWGALWNQGNRMAGWQLMARLPWERTRFLPHHWMSSRP